MTNILPEDNISPEDNDPMVIHDEVNKVAYTPKMEGFDAEKVCTQISAAIDKLHLSGLTKEDFFPTLMISEMAQDAGHGWAKDNGHYSFIYGYIFGRKLANFEKNRDTKLTWVERPMTEEEIQITKDINELETDLLTGDNDTYETDSFDMPTDWTPDNNNEPEGF